MSTIRESSSLISFVFDTAPWLVRTEIVKYLSYIDILRHYNSLEKADLEEVLESIWLRNGPMQMEDLVYIQRYLPSLYSDPSFIAFIKKTSENVFEIKSDNRSDKDWVKNCLYAVHNILPMLSGRVQVRYSYGSERFSLTPPSDEAISDLFERNQDLTSVMFLEIHTKRNNRRVRNYERNGHFFICKTERNDSSSYRISTNNVEMFIENVQDFGNYDGHEDLPSLFHDLSSLRPETFLPFSPDSEYYQAFKRVSHWE